MSALMDAKPMPKPPLPYAMNNEFMHS